MSPAEDDVLLAWLKKQVISGAMTVNQARFAYDMPVRKDHDRRQSRRIEPFIRWVFGR